MLYDVLLIAIIVASVIIGYKKGAAKTILSAASILISVIVALFLARILSGFIYDAFFKETLESKIGTALENSIVGGVADVAVNVVSAIPSVIVGAMSFFGLSETSFGSYCEFAAFEQGAKAAENIADKLSPVVVGLISIVLSVILFVVLSFILRLLIKPVVRIFKLPLIRTPNSLLGGVLGLVKGVIVVIIIAMLLKLVIPFIPETWTFLSQENIGKSYIFSFIYDGGLLETIRKFIYRIG